MLAIDGSRNIDIARQLGISYETAKAHIYRAMRKTGRETRTALALWYVRKFPTPEAQEAGYVSACLATIEGRTANFRHEV